MTLEIVFRCCVNGKSFFLCKISKMFVNVKRQNFTERRGLNREILVLERALKFISKRTKSRPVELFNQPAMR